MREQPPSELVSLLETLGLATAGQVRGVARRARRLAHDLPLFESVWVDALAQARVLTPFQAAEINAGRGAELRVGLYVLFDRLDGPAFGGAFRAREIGSSRFVRLLTEHVAPNNTDMLRQRLEELAEAGRSADCDFLALIEDTGLANGQAWAACPWTYGRSAGEWLAHHGRMPPEAVLEIARQMLVGLCVLERTGLLHGDLRVHQLLLTDAGRIVLQSPGWRGLVRPVEEYFQACDAPEIYDCLAPERIAERGGVTTASDVYSAGCLWWHLLTGRAPLAGGNSLVRLQAAQAAKICDVRRFAPDTPDTLAAAVSGGTQADPRRRPESFARLAAMLGPPTRQGELALAKLLSGVRRPRPRRRMKMPALRWSPAAAAWLIVAGCGLGLAAHWVEGRMGVEGRGSRVDGLVEGRGSRVEGGGGAPNSAPALASFPSLNPRPSTLDRSRSELLLPTDQPIRLTSFEIGPGQTVRGANGGRPVLLIDANGLEIVGREARFENIDFIYSPTLNPQPSTLNPTPNPQPSTLSPHDPALLRLSTSLAEFRNCTFRSVDSVSLPAGILWQGLSGSSAVDLPTGRLRFSNCLFQGLAAVVDQRAAGALVLDIDNSLHLGTGPLVRLDHAPRPDEALLVGLRRFTSRGAGPVIECRYDQQPSESGKLTIQATDCVFCPGDRQGLLLFAGPNPPERLLQSLAWSGSGSVLAPQTPLATWRQPDGTVTPASEDGLDVAGLVRSDVGFAGNADAGPAGSRIVRWQVPLNSSDPPGIDPRLLPVTGIPRVTSAADLKRG